MTKFQQCLRDEMVRRNYSPTTIRSYLHALSTCEHHHRRRRIDRLGADALRRYQAYLFEEKKLAVGTVGLHVAALRFFFVRVLKRRALKEDLPTPKRHRRLPTILSPDEVRRLIAGAKNLYHRTMLLMLYGTGLRRSELLQLKVGDIDSRHRELLADSHNKTPLSWSRRVTDQRFAHAKPSRRLRNSRSSTDFRSSDSAISDARVKSRGECDRMSVDYWYGVCTRKHDVLR